MNNNLSDKNYDYIIVGQGIAGTFLSYFLYKAGKKIVVYDKSQENTATKIATGIINPVTGRRIVRSWMIETVMPYAVSMYREMEQLLNISIISQKNILDFHPTVQMQMAFDERVQQETEYLKRVDDVTKWREFFDFPFGIGETNPCWLIDLRLLLSSWRNFLKKNDMLVEDEFIAHQPIAKNVNVIFADGVANAENPYFSKLPYSKNKGEALIIEVDGLPRNNIYKNGIIMVPWQQENLWWIGASYEWSYNDILPSQKFRKLKELQLNAFLKLRYKVVDHWATVRPANLERRPFVGLHPVYNNIGIFNGMGTKGCSLSPYFANEFTEYLTTGKLINPFADVRRFTKILSQ